jgi:bifunctional non-homologous end joining protein LigD
MATREPRSRKTSIKAASVVGSAKPRQTGRRLPDQPGAEHQAPIEGAVRAELPARQAPQLSQLADSPPAGDDWVSEVKFDGYRLLSFLSNGGIRILSRNGLDWTTRLPALARTIAQLKFDAVILDGELDTLDANGISSFADLQRALSEDRDSRLFYYAFDLLYLDGWDLRGCALLDRQKMLATLSD